MSLTSIDKLNRRVDVSAAISVYVYDYETRYNDVAAQHKIGAMRK